LAEIGYDAEWTVISAAEFGAPHKRERLFIIGISRPADNQGQPAGSIDAETSELPKSSGHGNAANARGVSHRRRNNTSISDKKRKAKKGRNVGNLKTVCGSQNAAGHDFRYSEAPSPFCRMDDGISKRVDRLRALGNAVVPQCAEWIGKRIASYQAELEIPW
jgi:DNA (cytosine-5)-methyltransferase 1